MENEKHPNQMQMIPFLLTNEIATEGLARLELKEHKDRVVIFYSQFLHRSL